MKLTRSEQETIVNYQAEGEEGTIYTSIPTDIRRLQRLSEKYPESYKLIREDGVGVTYRFSKKLMTLRKPKKKVELTEEHKKELINRLKN